MISCKATQVHRGELLAQLDNPELEASVGGQVLGGEREG